MLDQKLSEAKSKKDTLKARAKSAQTSKQIQEMVQGLNTSNAMAAFDRMEEKVMALEAESEATLQVTHLTLTSLANKWPLRPEGFSAFDWQSNFTSCEMVMAMAMKAKSKKSPCW